MLLPGGGDQAKAFQAALRFIHERINLLRVDAANARYASVCLG
jgi:hypothetical protein